MLRKTTIISLTLSFAIAFLTNSALANKVVEYWTPFNCNPQLGYACNLKQVPTGVNTVIVAFGMNYPVTIINGETHPNLAAEIKNLQDRGTSVWISSGGAIGTAPWTLIGSGMTANDVAKSYIHLVTTYNFDGIDFDFETGTGTSQQDADNLIAVMQAIHNQDPQIEMSLTFAADNSWGPTTPSNGIPSYLPTSIFKDAFPYVKYLNYMNYNLGSQPSICSYTATPAETKAPYGETGYWNSNCYVDNAYYATKTLAAIIGVSESEVKAKFMNGINIGYDGVNNITMTPDVTAKLVNAPKLRDIAGVFTWDINRDTPADKDGEYVGYNSGTTLYPAGAYTKSIIGGAN